MNYRKKMKAHPPTVPSDVTTYIVKLNLFNAMFEILKLGIW